MRILTQMLLEAKLSPMNLGDQRFAIEIAESEETRIQARTDSHNPLDHCRDS
jgi:hypothetical protein